MLSKCQGNNKRSWQIMKEITVKKSKEISKIKKNSLHSADQIVNEFDPFYKNAGFSVLKEYFASVNKFYSFIDIHIFV